jgi:hypothetical protein
MTTWLKKAYPKTLIGWLTLIAMVAVLVAVIIPEAKWGSSGSVTIPVDVVVFDALTAKPIEGAYVAIVWASRATSEVELQRHKANLSGGLSVIERIGTKTDHAGLATIDHEFGTGANYKHPQSHADTSSYWLIVSADGYGSAAVPLRYQTMTTKALREQGRLPAYVGLSRVKSE